MAKFSDDPKAMHFQMRFTDSDGGGSFRYFSALEIDEAKRIAESNADDFLAQQQARAFCGLFTPYRYRRVKVIQYDRVSNSPIKKGISFTVKLNNGQYIAS